ncbi:MAG: AAA family ATPase [Solobacterium sp.]|nr:AAA family ATPase [Solobacterium sp.]
MSDRRRDEKERLWNEVLNRKRSYEKNQTDSDITLSLNENEADTKAALKGADFALEQLNAILKKQQKDLEELSNQAHNAPQIDVSNMDMSRFEEDLKKDYGVEAKPVQETRPVSADTFTQVFEEASGKVIGQKGAIKQLVNAYRRPFIMGEEPGMPKNVILISGPRGSGRHEAIAAVTRAMYEKQAFVSDDVYTIDLSRYTSGGQEQIFLQDLYEALSGNGSVICFEHFESGFPSFLRMVDSLATEGSVTLNKRYVLTKGVLVENQTGLVKEAVDSLSAEGKYLVFVTDGKTSAAQDAFGADFMYHVMDTILFKTLDEESIRAVINAQTQQLREKAHQNLKIRLIVNDDVKDWVYDTFDKGRGTESITSVFYDFYVSLSHAVLNEHIKEDSEVQVSVADGSPCVLLNEDRIVLSRSRNSAEEIAAVNAELDEIVGLEQVKGYIRSLQSHIVVQEKRKAQGMKTASLSKHMIFTGNPGTGKTTIARLISRYMKAIGALSQGQLVEVTRADLVAQYVGQTAPLTMSVIRSAIGGVIFIDEAYALYRGKEDSFGLEAIDTLVKAMEDNREDLIVILAGYSKEMSVFLESNSGLKSRFPNLIHFPDYTGEELRKIAVLQAKSKGYVIAGDALPALEAYFNEVQSINAAEAGNGRLARNTVEEAILKQADRLTREPDADLSELKKEDFVLVVKVKPKKEEPSNPLEDLLKLTQK